MSPPPNPAAVSSAGMTCHPRGDSWVTAADVAGTPKMPSWHEFLKPSRLARPLRMCFPCVGINNGGRFLHEAGCEYTITDAHDIIGGLKRALLELDPATENNMHLGSTGDVTQVQLKDLKRPVDVLMAGYPCPGFQTKARRSQKRTRELWSLLLCCIGWCSSSSSADCCMSFWKT